MQWTVADITFIENHGNRHSHFCWEFMSRSFYIYKSYIAVSPNKLMMLQKQDKWYLPWIKSHTMYFMIWILPTELREPLHDCLKRWSPSDLVQSAPRCHLGETKSSWSQEWMPHVKRKSSADSGADSSLPPSVQQGGDNIPRVKPPKLSKTREKFQVVENLSAAADYMRYIEISISLGLCLDLLQIVQSTYKTRSQRYLQSTYNNNSYPACTWIKNHLTLKMVNVRRNCG